MLMGKRPRTPIKRTTSLKELSPDLSAATSPAEILPPPPLAELWRDGKLPPSPAPRRGLKRRCSGDPSVAEAAPFLTACGLCKRSLGPGFDTFMYRGEVAFCSSECREKQITIDEKKGRKKCSSPAIVKKAELPPPPKSSESSAGNETIVAA
ncbi:uncharacterized protein LOC110028964 [Phalaenopsis equestris]|uniref:uncharacterized protein LOC110028964 n=1 Tax=Phalaenopsis equestris TaxID=78828 RepID=UPI0009E2EAD5|nr:uncharacterized protein LOC110028964 [Phalaenopsis equestris]